MNDPRHANVEESHGDPSSQPQLVKTLRIFFFLFGLWVVDKGFLCCLFSLVNPCAIWPKGDEEHIPSALAEAIPSFVKLGLIMPEGVDALSLPKAASEPSGKIVKSAEILLTTHCYSSMW